MLTQVLHVNFSSLTVPYLISVVQGDTGRNLKCIVDDFTLESGWSATWYVERPSDIPVYNTATIETSDNSVNIELTAQSIAEVGDNKLQVRILDADDQVVTSFACILSVKPFGGIGAVESSTEANIFDQAVEQAITNFQTQAEEVAEEVIESIPADYTALTEEVDELKGAFDELYDANPLDFVTGYFNTQTASIITGGGYNNFITSTVLFDVPKNMTLTVDEGYQCWFYMYTGDTFNGLHDSFTTSRNFTVGARTRFMLSYANSSERVPITNPTEFSQHLHGISATGIIPILQSDVNAIYNCIAEENTEWED